MRSGGAESITCAELEARLPERLRSRDEQHIEVRARASREGTGLFDALDDALLQTVVARLDPLTSVRGCEAAPELFANLADRALMVRQLKVFVGWLPLAGTEVRTLAVAARGTSKKAALADELPPLLAKLPSLTALELSGAKTPASAIVAAAKACGAQLERLELRDVEMYDPGSQVAVAVARTKR